MKPFKVEEYQVTKMVSMRFEDAVAYERMFQNHIWGSEHDDAHTIEEWYGIIGEYDDKHRRAMLDYDLGLGSWTDVFIGSVKLAALHQALAESMKRRNKHQKSIRHKMRTAHGLT